jgi:hypothetical protein
MGHVFSLSKPSDVLLLLAACILAFGVVSAIIALAFAIRRKNKGIPATSTELTADDRTFLDRFLVSRIPAMTIVYSIALAIALGLVWVLHR